MCMIDYADEPVQILTDTVVTARKQHKCGECARRIEPGERYEKHAGIFDGSFVTYKTCVQCVAVREWLSQVCSGWVYGSVEEDIDEHFREGYGMWLGRAAVGMRRFWRKRDGSLMEPMELPAEMPTGAH